MPAQMDEWEEAVRRAVADRPGSGTDAVAAARVQSPAEPSAGTVLDSPATRAVALDWLLGAWAELRDDGPYSWVAREFLPPEHPHDAVTASSLAAHRAAKREAERRRNGQPRDVRYEGVPAELLTTTDVVELAVRPTARRTHLSYAASHVPADKVGPPTHFASHAWGRFFGQLITILAAYFSGAVASEIFIWLGQSAHLSSHATYP